MKKILASLVAVCMSFPAYAMTISDMKVEKTNNGWELRKGVDNFSDEVNCVVTWKDDRSVQVTNSSFYIAGGRGNGGLAGYKLRFDDRAPEDLKLSSKLEKDMSTIILSGARYREIMDSRRLRVLAVGVLSGTGFENDIDLTGLPEVISQWQAIGCPDD